MTPTTNVGFDYGRFTFDNVTCPADLSDVTFTVRAQTSTAAVGISHASDCSHTFTIKGATVIGDTYGIDFGLGPWGWNNLC